MEIIFEIIIEIVGWVMQVVAELLVQLFGQLVAEIIGHCMARWAQYGKPMQPWLAAVGCVMFGALVGAASLAVFPGLFMHTTIMRIINLILTPLAVGLFFAWFGYWLRNHARDTIRLEQFFYGYLFALAMALVRFIWGT